MFEGQKICFFVIDFGRAQRQSTDNKVITYPWIPGLEGFSPSYRIVLKSKRELFKYRLL